MYKLPPKGYNIKPLSWLFICFKAYKIGLVSSVILCTAKSISKVIAESGVVINYLKGLYVKDKVLPEVTLSTF
mgnify:CR=1 FL=1